MLASEFVITIPGAAATKGSMKCIGARGKARHVLVESHDTSGPWRATVVGWLTKTTRRDPVAAVKGQPVGVEATFTLPRPKGHYRTRRDPETGVVHTLGEVKASFRDAWPVGHQTGDVDKLARLILDALQDAGLFPDDCAVVKLTTSKFFPADTDPGHDDRLPYPGVRIRLYPI